MSNATIPKPIAAIIKLRAKDEGISVAAWLRRVAAKAAPEEPIYKKADGTLPTSEEMLALSRLLKELDHLLEVVKKERSR